MTPEMMMLQSIAKMQATVDSSHHAVGLLIEQVKVLYEDISNMNDRLARIEERLRVAAPNLGRGYTRKAKRPIESCDAVPDAPGALTERQGQAKAAS